MGHCEMLLEVAGLDKNAVAERTRKLASDDWSSFPPAEQRAYAYARKLTKTPWELTAADYQTLERDFGREKAMALFWWLCRGLYMTRVSDGFQLPLERDNVFADFAPQRRRGRNRIGRKPSNLLQRGCKMIISQTKADDFQWGLATLVMLGAVLILLGFSFKL